MARQRFIWPTIWTDPAFASLPPLGRLLFIALFSLADDEGRIDGTPAYLKAAAFPLDAITIDDVKTVRDTLAAHHPNVVLYTVDGADYIALSKWETHQRPKYPRPSRLPAPPAKKPCKPQGKHSRKPGGTLGERSSTSPGTLGEPSGNVGGNLGEASPMGWVGMGREETSVPSVSSPSSPRAKNRTDGRTLANLTLAATPQPIP